MHINKLRLPNSRPTLAYMYTIACIVLYKYAIPIIFYGQYDHGTEVDGHGTEAEGHATEVEGH